jgi:hypothetical protein
MRLFMDNQHLLHDLIFFKASFFAESYSLIYSEKELQQSSVAKKKKRRKTDFLLFPVCE